MLVGLRGLELELSSNSSERRYRNGHYINLSLSACRSPFFLLSKPGSPPPTHIPLRCSADQQSPAPLRKRSDVPSIYAPPPRSYPYLLSTIFISISPLHVFHPLSLGPSLLISSLHGTPSPVPILQETCSHQHSTLAFHCLVRSRSQSSFPSNVNRRRGSNSVEPQPQSLRRPLASARLLLPSVLPWCRSFHTASLRLGCQQHVSLVQGCKEARLLLRPSVQIA